MRDIIQLPNDPLKLYIASNNNYDICYNTNKQQTPLDNFSFEDDLVFDKFSAKHVRLKTIDGRHSFEMVRTDFSKLLKSFAPRFLPYYQTEVLAFTCRFTFVTRWGYLYIKPLGI